MGEKRAASLTAFQNVVNASRPPSRPPRSNPAASTTAFMAPALVPLIVAISIRSSASSRSSTPQVNAPCAPPPCRARSTVF
jgi:hypothetical protein